MAASRSSSFPSLDEIFSRLQKGPLYPLYLFHGNEAYLIDQAVRIILRRVGKAATVQSFYTGENSLDALLEAWGTPSLFAAQTVVVLKSAEQLKAAERERLSKEAAWHDATQPLVVCAHGRLDLRQSFFTLCAKKGFVAEFRPIFPDRVVDWVHRFARERKVRMSDDAALLLAELVGPDLLALSTETDKLVAFAFPRTDIDLATVTACAGDLHQHSVFDLADALGQRDRQKAMKLLHRVLTDEREALPVLHALLGHFRRLWQVKEFSASGKTEEEIGQAIGLRGPRVRALLSQSRFYTTTDLRQLWHRATTLDLRLKSSRTSPLALLDAFVLAVSARPS